MQQAILPQRSVTGWLLQFVLRLYTLQLFLVFFLCYSLFLCFQSSFICFFVFLFVFPFLSLHCCCSVRGQVMRLRCGVIGAWGAGSQVTKALVFFNICVYGFITQMLGLVETCILSQKGTWGFAEMISSPRKSAC